MASMADGATHGDGTRRDFLSGGKMPPLSDRCRQDGGREDGQDTGGTGLRPLMAAAVKP